MIDDLTIEFACFFLGVVCTVAAMLCTPDPTSDDGF